MLKIARPAQRRASAAQRVTGGPCIVGEETLLFGPKDVFVYPSWMPYRLEADQDAVLFSFSDRPVQQALNLWREAF